MHIIVDCDDVLFYFVDSFLVMINEEYGTSLKGEDIIRYRFHECPGFPLRTMEDEREAVRRFGEKGLYRNLPPIPGAKQVLEELIQQYILDAVTQRPNTSRVSQDTHDSIQEHYPNLFRRVCIIEGSKLQVANFQTALIIEDKPSTAIEFAAHNINVILFDTPRNQETQYPELGHPRIKRKHNWEEIGEYLQRIEEESLWP